MGIFDKWTKKTKDEQLAASTASSDTTKGAKEEGAKTTKAAKEMETLTEAAHTPALVNGNGEGAPLRAQEILLRAHITEKAAADEGKSVYTFVVPIFANKYMVKMAVKQMFGLMPVAVRMINRAGKQVRFGRSIGHRSNRKIARVYMKEGEVLSIHKGV